MNARGGHRAKRAVILSIGLLLLVLGALEVAFRTSSLFRSFEEESLYAVKAAELSSEERELDIAFMGDSRVLHAIDPRAVQAAIEAERDEELYVYNAGLPHAAPLAQLAIVRRLLSREPRPRLVVIAVSPHMFSSRADAAAARESLSTVWRLRDLPTAVRAGASPRALAEIAASNVSSLYRHRSRLRDELADAPRRAAPAASGLRGFLPNGEVDAATQDARAQKSAESYRAELLRPHAELGNEQMGYFVEALRQLKSSGVTTLVLNPPSASQLDLAQGPGSIYDEHTAWARARTAEHGATWVDVKSSPALGDQDYVDGVTLGGHGAMRFSAWLAHEYIVPALGGRRPSRPEGCETLFDFEGGGLHGFTHSGSAFEQPLRVQSKRLQQPVYGHVGRSFLSTYGAAGDRDMGEATSPAFVVSGNSVRVLVGGGAHLSQAVAVIVDGVEVAVGRGRTNEGLQEVVLDTSDVRGLSAVLGIRDHGSGVFEHINVDHAAICP